jgi:aminopeptidase N
MYAYAEWFLIKNICFRPMAGFRPREKSHTDFQLMLTDLLLINFVFFAFHSIRCKTFLIYAIHLMTIDNWFMRIIQLFVLMTGICFSELAIAQLLEEQPTFTRADSLRGTLTPARTGYDVTFYHLDVKIDPGKKSIEGANTIVFDVRENTKLIQVDLFENMKIDRIQLDDHKKLSYHREHNAVFIELPETLQTGTSQKVSIEYHGTPQEAQNPPWDGGFVWASDSSGNPWVAVTCQGTGASLWWPNKDHQSDEPDSMMISITVPDGLENISNGRLRNVSKPKKGWTKYDWFVSYPINNYNVTVNIGKFAHFGEQYIPAGGDTLNMDYYVLPQDLEKAKRHFAQTRPMMEFFYKYFGPYPFVNDGYKLIQSPHLGMEHQSAVAYGNGFLNGYKGTASSEVGLKFDFIILHETAHEWWGNSITSNDIADMWIHESFGAYSEALYVEHAYGYDESMKYINGKKQSVSNDRPIIGPFGVNQEGSGDMYDKGQLVLNTLRHVINNDELWFDMLRDMNVVFRHRNIDGQEIFNYFIERTGMDLNYFFDQYFRQTTLPALVVSIEKKGDHVTATYTWEAETEDFRMPVKVTTAPGRMEMIYPNSKQFQTIDLQGLHPDEFKIAEDQYFVELFLWKTYIDPEK